MKKVLQNKDKGLGFLRHWKVMTMTLLLLTFSIGNVWGAAPSALTYQTISSTTIIYTSPTNLAALGYVQDGKGTQTYSVPSSDRGNGLNPTDETKTDYAIGTNATTLKSVESNKSVYFYVKNVTKVEAYVKNNSSGDGKDRTTTIVATPTSGSALDGSVTLNGASGKAVVDGLDKDKNYTIVIHANGADMFLYAVRLTAATLTPTAPAITSPASDPDLQTITQGETKTFEVTATGYPAPTYQWYKNSSKSTTGAEAIAEATAASYTTPNTLVASADNYYFYCVATNSQGTAQSPYFSLKVNPIGADLTAHVPGVYESTEAGGYSASLITYNERQYETYYFYSNNSKIYLSAGNKAYNATGHYNLIDGSSFSAGTEYKAGWVAVAGNSMSSGSVNNKQFDINASTYYLKMRTKDTHKIRIKVSGYDQLAFYGKNNSTSDNDKKFAIKIDGITVANPNPSSNSNTIFAFDLTTAEHYIEITTGGSTSSDCQFQAISLRLPACTKPAAPTALSCTAQTANTLTFGWTKETNAVGYVAKLYSDSGCETEVDSKDLGDVNTVTFTGLSNSSTYYCKVQSKGNGTDYCEEGSVTSAANGTTETPSCGDVTAPTSLLVTATTAEGASFTIVDDEDAFNYELYIIDSNTAPTGSSTATHTSTEKTKDVTGLTSGTTYYAWVRSVCDADHKSTWTASSSFKVRTDPALVIYPVKYVIGSGNLDMSSRYESANTDSPVLWEMKEDYAGASVTGAGLFTATVAGEYTIVANQAGNATYVAGHAEQTVEVLEAEISDIYIWQKNSSHGGDGKCVTAVQANQNVNANQASTTLDYSTLTIEGMNGMGRPASAGNVKLTFAVKNAYNSIFGITSVCAYGKIEEAGGIEYSWNNTDWTAVAGGESDNNKHEFTAPTGTYPTNFYIRFTNAVTDEGGLWLRNTLVTLEAKKTVDEVTEALTGVEINGEAISAANLTTLLTDKTLNIATAYAAAPTVNFIKQVTTTYEGGWPADVTSVDMASTASDITTAWQASQTIGGQAYAITLAKPTVPSLATEATAFTLTSAKNATDTKSFTFSGLNLAHSVTISLESDIAGLSVTPANVIPDGSGAITNEEVTITYKSLENVAEANVNLIVSYSETVKLTIPLTYSSTRGWDTPNNVTGSITWDFSKAASSDVTISNSEVTVLANYDVENDPTKIVTDNLAGKGEKFSNNWLRTFYLQFTTTVNGRLAMEYSDTGSSGGRRTRYMYVNGVRYGTGSNTSASHTLQDPVYVTAGTITLTAKIDTEGKEEAQWNDANVQLYQMVFVQTHDITFVDGGSIPAIHAANGETVSLPDVDAGDVPAGMSFNGWFIGDTKIGNAGDDYTMGDVDVALTAKFRTACTTPTIAWDVQPTNSRSITGTQDVSVTLTGYTGDITWTSSTPAVATISGTNENATITYVGEGSTTITAQFIIPEGQSLCDGTYKVTKEITLMDCPEPAALTNEIARFQVPACGIDHEHALTNEDVARDNCTVTVSGIGGGTSNWYQNTTNNLWYAKIAGDNYYIAINVTGGIQEGDLVYVYMRAQNGGGVKINKTPAHAVTTTQNDNAEVMLEYEVASDDMEDDGSIKFLRTSSNTYINRIIIVRPPCRATNVAWATEPAKAHVGDADGTATITTNYVTGVTYSSSNTDVATIASGNGTNTVTIHYVAAGTTTITATVTGEDPFCTDPVSVSKEIRVIGDAPAYGTLYKFEVKEMADAYIFSENNASMEMTTDNYLSLLQSGELMASVSGGYNRLYISNNAFVFANSAGGQLTMSLDYPLAVGDVIKYKNVNGNNDRANLNEPRDAGRTTVLSGNGGTAIQTFDVPAAWAGATELTLTRNNNNPKIAYFEVYRRPVATGVSLSDMTIRQGVSTTPVMTLAPTTDAIVNSQAWEIVGTPTNLTGAGINATTGAITTGTLDDETQNGSMTVRVTINGTLSATCTVTVIKSYVRANVSGSMLWDWTASCWDGQPNVELTGDEKDTDILMANTGTSMVCSDDFRSDMLVINGNYAWRLENTNKYFQGTKITIYPSVAGLMRVNFRAPSSGQTCTVKINGVTAGAHGNSFGWSDYVEVPANTTDGIAIEMTNSTNGYTRVNKIEFLALENRRTAGWIKPGELGTVCLENTSIVEGATIYELQGPDQYGKLVFDEVQSGEVVAGTPYLFEATATGQISFYKKVNAAHAGEAGELNGMHGTFSGETFSPSDGNAANLYYFSGNAIWCVANRSTDANIPAHGCYLNMEEFRELPIPSPTPAPGRRRITLGVNGKNTPTGIENGELLNGENGVQKVLINGELFILRGEKMYDATGRLVK